MDCLKESLKRIFMGMSSVPLKKVGKLIIPSQEEIKKTTGPEVPN